MEENICESDRDSQADRRSWTGCRAKRNQKDTEDQEGDPLEIFTDREGKIILKSIPRWENWGRMQLF